MKNLMVALFLASLVGPAAALETCDPLLQKPIVTTTANGDRLYQRPNTATLECQRWNIDALSLLPTGPDYEGGGDDTGGDGTGGDGTDGDGEGDSTE